MHERTIHKDWAVGVECMFFGGFDSKWTHPQKAVITKITPKTKRATALITREDGQTFERVFELGATDCASDTERYSKSSLVLRTLDQLARLEQRRAARALNDRQRGLIGKMQLLHHYDLTPEDCAELEAFFERRDTRIAAAKAAYEKNI